MRAGRRSALAGAAAVALVTLAGCSTPTRALGTFPRVDDAALAAGAGMVATVWAKVPGESDGTCNGGPAAGQWWDEVALELARNAS